MFLYKNLLRLVISNLPEHIPELLWSLCWNCSWNYTAGRLDFKTRISWRFMGWWGGTSVFNVGLLANSLSTIDMTFNLSAPIHMKNVHDILICQNNLLLTILIICIWLYLSSLMRFLLTGHHSKSSPSISHHHLHPLLQQLTSCPLWLHPHI